MPLHYLDGGALGDHVSVLEGLGATFDPANRPTTDILAPVTAAGVPKFRDGPQIAVGPFLFPADTREHTTVITRDLLQSWAQRNGKAAGKHPMLLWLSSRVQEVSRILDKGKCKQVDGVLTCVGANNRIIRSTDAADREFQGVRSYNGYVFGPGAQSDTGFTRVTDFGWRILGAVDGRVPIAFSEHPVKKERWALFSEWKSDRIVVRWAPYPTSLGDDIAEFIVKLVAKIVDTFKALLDVLKAGVCLLARQKLNVLANAAAKKTELTPDQLNEFGKLGVNPLQVKSIIEGGSSTTAKLVVDQVATALCGAQKTPPSTKKAGFPTTLVLAGGALAAVAVFLAVRG